MAELIVKLLFDLSIICSMIILSYLSRKMGDALKIRPYYVILYGTALLVAFAGVIEIARVVFAMPIPPTVSLAVRCAASVIAFGVCLRYWKWLFSEFFEV